MPKKKKKKTKVRKKTFKKVKRKTKVRKKLRKKIKRRRNKENLPTEIIIKTKPEWTKQSLANKAQYLKKYNDSIKNNNGFWKKEGKRITWIKRYKKIKDVKYSNKDVRIKWFYDGT